MTDHAPATMTARTPEDLLAVIPLVLGFHPAESLVMLTLAQPGPTFHARVDLPPPRLAHVVHEAVRPLREAALHHRVGQVAFVVYTGEPRLAQRVEREVDRQFADVGIALALRVHDGRWSHLGDPGPGHPFDVSAHPFAAQSVYEGTVIHASRADLAATLGPDHRGREAVCAALPGALRALPRRQPVAESAWVAGQVDAASGLSPAEVARLVVALTETGLRDGAWRRVTRARASVLLPWWTDVVRRSPEELVATPACLLAFTAWLAGHGALAWCALDRCQEVEPGHAMAATIATLLEGAVPPQEWEEMAAEPGSGPA